MKFQETGFNLIKWLWQRAYMEAKAAILSLQTVPYQRRWVEALQDIELKREVAGTSRIEGAEFTEQELDLAFQETPEPTSHTFSETGPCRRPDLSLDCRASPRPTHYRGSGFSYSPDYCDGCGR